MRKLVLGSGIGLALSAALAPGCKNSYDPPDVGAEKLHIQSADTVPADGATIVPIVISGVNGGLDPRHKVTCGTTLGSLLAPDGSVGHSVTIIADSVGGATCHLKAPYDVGAAVVTVHGAIDQLIDTITFTRAYPETISIGLSAGGVKKSSAAAVTISVRLGRGAGTPSRGAGAGFRAVTGAGVDFGAFGLPGVSDSAGGFTVTYFPGPTTFEGLVTIQATIVTAIGDTVAASATLAVLADSLVK